MTEVSFGESFDWLLPAEVLCDEAPRRVVVFLKIKGLYNISKCESIIKRSHKQVRYLIRTKIIKIVITQQLLVRGQNHAMAVRWAGGMLKRAC